MIAAATGQIEAVKFLLEQGALVDEINRWGSTALMIAGYRGRMH